MTGNPDTTGVLLTNLTLPGWLGAATSAVAGTVWVVTAPATNHVVYAVANRTDLATEFNGSNNVPVCEHRRGGLVRIPCLIQRPNEWGGPGDCAGAESGRSDRNEFRAGHPA